jgi:hypothetical protein
MTYLSDSHIGKFENLHINFDELKIEIKTLPLNQSVFLNILPEEDSKRFSNI